jgi:tetratricopeptide (TPR) repeat protein
MTSEAVQLYCMALQKDANCIEAFAGRACAYNALQQWTQCIEDSTQALALGCDDASLYYNRGNAYWCLQNYHKAIDDTTEALARQSHFPEALCCRGAAHSALSAWEEAISDFTKAIELVPLFPIARCSRGIAFCQTQKWALAIDDLSLAVKGNPQYALAIKWLAHAKENMAHAEKAAEEMMQSLLKTSASEPKVTKNKSRSRRKKSKAGSKAPEQQTKGPLQSTVEGKKNSLNTSQFNDTQSAGKSIDPHVTPGAATRSSSPELPESKDGVSMKYSPLEQKATSSSPLHRRRGPTKLQVSQSLHSDLRKIEVTAMVEAAITIGTAKALGARIDGRVDGPPSPLDLAAASQMQNQTKNYLIAKTFGFTATQMQNQMKDEYISEFLNLNYGQSQTHSSGECI